MLSNSLTDAELIAAIIQNDEKAFNCLFKRHWARVYAVAYKYVKDRELCREITHDIFLNIWNKRCDLHINSFKSYVVTAASYHGIRKRQLLNASPIQYIEDYVSAENGSGVFNNELVINLGETKLCQHELELEIDQLLNSLPKRCHEIYILSRKHNLSISEISSRLNISKKTVENQLTIALKHLRKSLKHLVAGMLLFAFFEI